MREFLEKTKVKKLLDDGWAKGIYPRNDIMQLFSATEQEIVKPYFDRLKKEIDRYTDMHADGDFYIKNYEVKRMIDKILSEQEKEE